MYSRLKGPGIFLLIAAAGAYGFIYLYLNSRIGYGWDNMNGEIVDLEVRSGLDYHYGWVKYTYKIAGKVYEGGGVPLDEWEDPIIYGGDMRHRAGSELLYWNGKTSIPILVNPDNPAESTTYADYHAGFLAGAIIFVLMLLLALAAFITAIGGKRHNRLLTEEEARQFMDAAQKKYKE